MANTVNERSTYVVTVSFFDEDDAAVTPAAATYRLDDVKSGTALVPKTSITGLDDVIDIIITSLQNRIINDAHSSELRRLTIEFDYDDNSAKHGTGEYLFEVTNLRGVP